MVAPTLPNPVFVSDEFSPELAERSKEGILSNICFESQAFWRGAARLGTPSPAILEIDADEFFQEVPALRLAGGCRKKKEVPDRRRVTPLPGFVEATQDFFRNFLPRGRPTRTRG
jgi:hypothetical protein